MTEADALVRGRGNATSIVSTFVTGTWILALVAGFDWWLWFMLFGYVVLVPTVSRLFVGEWRVDESGVKQGSEVNQDENNGWRGHPGVSWDDAGTGEETSPESSSATNNRDALKTLRDRYARGELTDEQFERKVERLLETETLEDVEDRSRRSASVADESETSREPDR